MNLEHNTFLILQTCHQFSLYKENLMNSLAKSIRLEKKDIFYHWCFRKISQSGIIIGSDWKYFFHGLECDLRNCKDNQVIRIEFGPSGRIDTFTSWGLLLFILTLKEPSNEIIKIKKYFSENSGNYLSDFNKIDRILSSKLEELEIKKLIAKASLKNHLISKRSEDELYFDSLVCQRKVISNHGLQLLL